MSRVLAIALAGLLCSCEHDAFEVSPKANGIVVERIFVHEGCAGYRFEDNGHRYYVVCGNGSATTMSRKCTPCGKGCLQCVDEDVPTVAGESAR